MEIYRRLSTPKLWAVVWTQTISDAGVLADGILTNPTTLQIIIEDSTGTVVQALDDMTPTAETGKFYYDGYAIPADANTGIWHWEARAASGTKLAIDKGSFIVEEQAA